MSATHDSPDLIAAAPPNCDSRLVAAAVAEQFGLVGDYTHLVSEQDQNFCLTAANHDRYLVKVSNSVGVLDTTAFQVAVLDYLERCGISGVPRNVVALSGDYCGSIQAADGVVLGLRVLTWLPGKLLSDSRLTPRNASLLGSRLAALDRALEGFVDASKAQVSLWDTQCAGQLRGLLMHVTDVLLRQQLQGILDSFEERIAPALPALPAQVIHNDANTENILLDSNGEVSGIIDFGDVLRAPRIVEVSTAAAYLRPDGGDSLQLIALFVAGYQLQNPLTEPELGILFELILTRLAMTVVHLHWRLATRDDDDPYLQKQLGSESAAVAFLRDLVAIGPVTFRTKVWP